MKLKIPGLSREELSADIQVPRARLDSNPADRFILLQFSILPLYEALSLLV